MSYPWYMTNVLKMRTGMGSQMDESDDRDSNCKSTPFKPSGNLALINFKTSEDANRLLCASNVMALWLKM